MTSHLPSAVFTVRVAGCLFFANAAPAFAADSRPRPAEAIQDNSFFIEEAYNQEAGVVQHILTIGGFLDRRGGRDDQSLTFAFTQEWPLASQAHQLSYTIPYSFTDREQSENGREDIFINYRFQLLTETAARPAVAPRVSLILPTGDEDKGFGNDRLGYQFNLPVSKVVSDRWSVHANAGATFFPDVKGRDLTSYNLGVSAIYALGSDFNLMVEIFGNWDEEVSDDGARDSVFSAAISPGFRYAFNLPNDAQLVTGLAVPIGLNSAAPDYGVLVYFSFEHPFQPATTPLAQGKSYDLVSHAARMDHRGR